jgi:hypothetical protein
MTPCAPGVLARHPRVRYMWVDVQPYDHARRGEEKAPVLRGSLRCVVWCELAHIGGCVKGGDESVHKRQPTGAQHRRVQSVGAKAVLT